MINSRHPNTSVITAEADQLITIKNQAGNNLIVQWFHGLQLGCIERLVGQLGKEVGNGFWAAWSAWLVSAAIGNYLHME